MTIFTHWAKSEKWVMIARYLVSRSIYVTKNPLYAGLAVGLFTVKEGGTSLTYQPAGRKL
jgi:hypothetical protein